MRGEIVIVRGYGEKPLIRRVWDSNKNLVYITNDEQFQLLVDGKETIEPIGFPKEDVFKYDQTVAILIKENRKYNWAKLVPWDNS